MDAIDIVDVLSRWIHVGTAVALVGGSTFMRFVLMPAAAELPEAEHNALRERVLGRWKKWVMVGIALFLVSGFYNYVKVAIPQHKGDSLYHALMGTKIILALVVFFLASALVGRASAFEKLRAKRPFWLGILILLSAAIIALAGVLKVRGTPATDAGKTTTVAARAEIA